MPKTKLQARGQDDPGLNFTVRFEFDVVPSVADRSGCSLLCRTATDNCIREVATEKTDNASISNFRSYRQSQL